MMTTIKKQTAHDTQDEKRSKATEASAKKQNHNWKENHANQALSGIEFRKAKTNELVSFITVRHDEILEKSNSFRIAILVNDEDDTFTLPPKQTFEEMIQAKRRQQMLLYGPGNSSTNSSVLSDRAARRVATAARRQSALNAAINRQNVRNLSQDPVSPVRPRTSSRTPASRSKKAASKKRPPSNASSNNRRTTTSKTPTITEQPEPQPETVPTITPSTSGTSKVQQVRPIEVRTPDESFASDSSNNKSVNLITSMKELSRQTPYLDTLNKKEIKMLLKSAAPGAAIVLSNGIVVKKSRRGGARAGAGRKRSRPVPNGEIPTSGPSGEQRPGTSSSANPVDAKPIQPISSSSSQPVAGSSMHT